jgi:alkylated DNA repair dioxygenase AlkB
MGHGSICCRATAKCYFFPDAIEPNRAAALFVELTAKIRFTQEEGVIYGRRQFFPRETAWFSVGPYKYSAFTHPPAPMADCLLPLKALAEALAHYPLNGVLLNHYRDGRDSVSWHSDDKPTVGLGPVIASISLGATRRFLKHRKERGLRLSLDLTAGSCLIMAGTMQQHWLHCVPKERHSEPRINLTFRKVAAGD